MSIDDALISLYLTALGWPHYGRSGENRTHDFRLKRAMLLPAELRTYYVPLGLWNEEQKLYCKISLCLTPLPRENLVDIE